MNTLSIYVVYVSIKLVLLWLLLLMGAMWPIGLLDGFCLHPNINVMTYSKETLKLCEQKKKKSKYIMMLLCMSGVNVTRYMSIMTKVNTRVKGNAASNFKASMEDFDSY